MPVGRRFQRGVEIRPMGRLHPVHQPVPNQFAFLVACFVAAPVGVTDQPCRIQHQNHALCGIQDLLIKIAFPL